MIRRYPAYDRAVIRPICTPSTGFDPYAPLPTIPEMSTTPSSITGIATITSRRGRSPNTSHATIATITTWTLPITVPRPAPMTSTA